MDWGMFTTRLRVNQPPLTHAVALALPVAVVGFLRRAERVGSPGTDLLHWRLPGATAADGYLRHTAGDVRRFGSFAAVRSCKEPKN